jgi:hypothetical protein
MIEAIGPTLTPIAVAALAYILARNQSRSGELLRTRLEGYRSLAPVLNQLMCYMALRYRRTIIHFLQVPFRMLAYLAGLVSLLV